MRRTHNQLKFEFLRDHVKRGSQVLDMGCGFGGDFHKWGRIGANVIGADPSEFSLQEARRRFPDASLLEGDIFKVPRTLRFDVICFNFSLQYCKPHLRLALQRCYELLRENGKIVGVIPDGSKIADRGEHYVRSDPEHITMYIPDSPYYQAYGPVTEPIVYKRDLTSAARGLFELVHWSDFSDGIYSKFILRKDVDSDRITPRTVRMGPDIDQGPASHGRGASQVQNSHG